MTLSSDISCSFRILCCRKRENTIFLIIEILNEEILWKFPYLKTYILKAKDIESLANY